MVSLPPQDLPSRPRRNRRSSTFRSAMSETHISPANFILPVFVHEGDRNEPIASMPGVSRLTWRKGLVDTVREARSLGVNQVVIFPKVSVWSRRAPEGSMWFPAAAATPDFIQFSSHSPA
jgi:delta-aminolevulinic acid dehydratase/porphobilinogen synthase